MVYLDHASTTPLDPRVLDAMLPYLRDQYGNASSPYELGRAARRAVEDARDLAADYLGATAGEIVFTSGGSESDNLALCGTALAARAAGSDKRRVLISPIEHPAVAKCDQRLAQCGFQVDRLTVNADGRVDPGEVAARLTDDTLLVSVMHVNNEIGTIEPIAEIGAACRARGVLFHSDAVQSLGALPINVGDLNVDMLAASAHKIGGPKGVGLAYVRRGVHPASLILGGGQERGRRAGTENVAGIVGLAAAIDLLKDERERRSETCRARRDQLLAGLLALPGASLNGPREGRAPNNANVSFAGVKGEMLVAVLDGVGLAASAGSACASGATDPSPTLLALGQSAEQAKQAARFTVGYETTGEEIRWALSAIASAVSGLRDAASSGLAALGS